MKNKFLGTGQSGFHPIRKIEIGLRGCWYAVCFDFAVAYKLVLSLAILAVCAYYRQWLDFGLIFVATGVMLAAEMFNTAIEALCDFIETEQNEKIGIVKDVSAAAAGVGIVVWAAVLAGETYRVLHFVE